MTAVPTLLRIAVGVVVERRKALSAWTDTVWRPIAVLAGLPETAPWTTLSSEGDRITFYAGPAEIELHRSEAGNYQRNLASGAPALWVALHETGGDPPYTVAAVTADPAEGESLTEPGQGIVDSVPMPASVRDAIADFIVKHPADHGFTKRIRDRAEPEALARRPPRAGRQHDG